MKLPEDKKTRNQVLVMIVIGIIAVIYLGFTYGISPLLAMKEKSRKNIKNFTTKTKKAVAEIKYVHKDREDSAKALIQAKEIADENVLLPTLANNYLIPAQAIIEACAKAAKVEAQVKQLGIANFKSSGALRAYRVGVVLECGYNELIDFLSELEKNNACICVPSISISGNASDSGRSGRSSGTKDITKHSISLEVQWPIWASLSGRSAFEKRVEKAVNETTPKNNTDEKADEKDK